ncbi:MAG TPA: non-homologous end-joining DNA ligase [Selenomonadales bacterium]|nr:non-homologous end-joining DNA ligase [Selenomonadales bacterium]
MPTKTEVAIDGHTLTLSNLDKVFYRSSGFSKGQVIDYYARIAPALLPHLAGRPVTLKRYPGGAADADFFYQKECPSHRPDWVNTAPVWSEGNDRNVNYCLIEDLPSLVWAANLASIELHTSLSLARDVATPTLLVFDLDPGPPAAMLECTQVALELRTVFDRHNLATFPKTSGSKGLQLYVPLNTPVSYDETKSFARALAQLLEKQHPGRVVSKMAKKLRAGKVFVDWSQNDEHKTTVCVYSLRAKDQPTVSTPVTWEEVEDAWKKQDAGLLSFDTVQVLRRFEQHGDLFAPVLTLKQKLPRLP